MFLAQFVRSKTEPLHRAGPPSTRPEILHQHVGLRHQLGQNLAADFALDVDRQRALAAIG
jgi:hypothetical protein